MKPPRAVWLELALDVINSDESIEGLAKALNDTRQNVRVKLSGALLSAAIAGQVEVRRKG